ncbi:MAG: NAD-dependent epimerase/dehydratase family protein [Solirubrobacterales bacterium]|nr:NAD-dependent epimerase/dehydratase family protein [Solirubrobacterales bacterium]
MSTVLVTGASGYVGSAIVPRLKASGHTVRAFARTPAKVTAPVDQVVAGDAVTGQGLDRAMDGVDVAYFLIHSMEGAAGGGFDSAEASSAENFAAAAQKAGVRRVVYLGGLVPTDHAPSRHLGSRLAVERTLLASAPEAVAFRASIVIGAGSRSFRFLVRLVERTPILPLPSWQRYRTQPIDERDVLALLHAAGTREDVTGAHTYDIGGPDVVTYGELITRIRDSMMVSRPTLALPLSVTPIAAKVAAAIAGEDVGLIEPLMESLASDLLVNPAHDAPRRFGVRMHSFDASVERALRDWERTEELAAR